MGVTGDGYTAHSPMGDWLSWLERTVHIREVTGSNPVSPTTHHDPAAMPDSRVPGTGPRTLTLHIGRRA